MKFSVVCMLSVALTLSACGAGNPFLANDDEVLEEGDPNTNVNNKFAWDPENDLTMNKVTYDRVNDQLVINNIPFDGPDGRYDNVLTWDDGTKLYKSRSTPTTGLITHYALFMERGALQATAAAGVNWVTYGNAGANINRSSFKLPDGEYAYLGTYAAVRSFDKRAGLELVQGEVELNIDTRDFDETPDGLEGDIIGTIYNRTKKNFDGSVGADLPDISLVEVSYNKKTGVFEKGTALTTNPFTNEIWSSGDYEGMIGGENGENWGGIIVMEGAAEIQMARYEVINSTTADGTLIVSNGLVDAGGAEALIRLLDAGGTLPPLLRATVPPGATVQTVTIYEMEVESANNAREIGIFLADQL